MFGTLDGIVPFGKFFIISADFFSIAHWSVKVTVAGTVKSASVDGTQLTFVALLIRSSGDGIAGTPGWPCGAAALKSLMHAILICIPVVMPSTQVCIVSPSKSRLVVLPAATIVER